MNRYYTNPSGITGEGYSGDTSMPQIPGLFKRLVEKGLWSPGMVNLDIGGGKYDLGTEYAEEHGVRNIVHDIENRSEEHNSNVERWLETNQPDTITISNVLNVIPDKRVRRIVLEFAKKNAGNSPVFIWVHEGEAKDRLKPFDPVMNAYRTSKGWQLYQKTEFYVPEVEDVFPYVERHGKLIVASVKPF